MLFHICLSKNLESGETINILHVMWELISLYVMWDLNMWTLMKNEEETDDQNISDQKGGCQHEDIRQCVQAGNNIFVLMHTWYRYVEMRISDSMYKQETIYLSWCTYDACVESLRRLSMIRVLIHNIWGMILYVDAT